MYVKWLSLNLSLLTLSTKLFHHGFILPLDVGSMVFDSSHLILLCTFFH